MVSKANSLLVWVSVTSSHSKERRAEVAQKILIKYPDRVPVSTFCFSENSLLKVIVERASKSNSAPVCSKRKFLVPQEITVGSFLYEVRHHMSGMHPETTIYLFVGDDRLPPACMIRPLFKLI